jgi:hypothetical protein
VTGGEAPRTWRARAFRPGDEAGIVRLFEQVFGRPITVEYWRWKLRTRPSPVDNVGLAVGDDDRPIFHLGGMPCRFQIGSHEATVMVAVDGMTAPAYRRRGVLTTVGQGLFQNWREAGIAMALGLPNEQWDRTGFGWQVLFPLRWRVRLLHPERILARRLGLPWLRRWRLWDTLRGPGKPGTHDVRIREIDRAGPELDEVWERCRSKAGVSPVRDREWIEWRYLRAPHLRYRVLLAERAGQPVGFAAYGVRVTPGRRWGLIPELLASPDDLPTARSLLQGMVYRLAQEDVDGISALAIPHTWLDRLLRRQGFFWSKGAFSVECVIFAPWLRLEDLRLPGIWHLTGGEFDVI